MAAHICLLLYISILGAGIYAKGHVTERKNRLFIRTSLLGVFLLQALRSTTVGWDTHRYYQNFLIINEGKTTKMIAGWESLYVLLNKGIGLLTKNPQWLLAACSVVIVIGIGIFIENACGSRYSAFWPVFFFVCFYHYFNSTNLIREYMAIAFTANIYTVLSRGISRKNIINAILLLVIGTQLHQMSIVSILIFIPFFFKRFDKKSLLLMTTAAIAAFTASDVLLTLVMRLLPKYQKYSSSARLEGSTGVGATYLLLSMIKILMIVFVLIRRRRLNKEESREIYILSYLMIVAVALTLLRTKVMLALRTGYYFEIFFVIFVPVVLGRLVSTRNRQILYFGFYLLGWVFMLYLLIFSNGGTRGCIPYHFFWS